jgi:ketosteroid isomerase-like protein
MADPNVEALKPVYEEWGRGDWSSRFETLFAPDYEWGWSDDFGLGAPSRDPDMDSGTKSARLLEWLSTWKDWSCEAEDYLANGDKVLVLCRYSGIAKGSGVPVDVVGAHVWTMDDGIAKRLEVFSDRERAREAAGLSS